MKRILTITCLFSACLLLIIAGISCSSGIKKQVELGSEFSLLVGDTANLKSEGITLKFLEVESDTRLPEGSSSSIPAEAACKLEVSNRGTVSRITIPVEGFSSFTKGHLGDYTVLSRLDPKPEIGKTITQSEYKLYLTLSK